MTRRKRKPVQLSLDEARKPEGHGGWRPGAGRPRGRKVISHDARPVIAKRHPQHVTLKLADDMPSIRRRSTLQVVRDVIRKLGQEDDLRVVHFIVLRNHIHMLVETTSAAALGHAMQGFCVMLAKRLNRALGRKGTVFAERYHARALTTPTEVRNALRYVLLNGDRHEAQRGAQYLSFDVDPFSSGAWFDGWADDRWREGRPDGEQPTSAAGTWLLREGWRKAGGPIAFDDTPGSSRRGASARMHPR
jgi:REP element-mobilizing transposase RayT